MLISIYRTVSRKLDYLNSERWQHNNRNVLRLHHSSYLSKTKKDAINNNVIIWTSSLNTEHEDHWKSCVKVEINEHVRSWNVRTDVDNRHHFVPMRYFSVLFPMQIKTSIWWITDRLFSLKILWETCRNVVELSWSVFNVPLSSAVFAM